MSSRWQGPSRSQPARRHASASRTTPDLYAHALLLRPGEDLTPTNLIVTINVLAAIRFGRGRRWRSARRGLLRWRLLILVRRGRWRLRLLAARLFGYGHRIT